MVSTIEKDNNNNNNSSIIRIKKTVKNLRIYTRHTKERFHSHTIYALIYFSIKLFYGLWIDDVRGHVRRFHFPRGRFHSIFDNPHNLESRLSSHYFVYNHLIKLRRHLKIQFQLIKILFKIGRRVSIFKSKILTNIA